MTYKLKEVCQEIIGAKNGCNLNCLHCSSNYSGKLDFEKTKDIIDDVYDLGCEILQISGGEPLEHENCFEILDYSKNNVGINKVELYSTGYSKNNDINKLRKTGADKVISGLHGTREVNMKVTQVDNYDITCEFLQKAQENGIEVGVHFVPMKLNIDDFENFIYEMNERGIGDIKILRLMPQGRALDNLEIELHPDEYFNFLKNSQKFHNVDINYGLPTKLYLNAHSAEGCKAGISTCAIDARGFVYACPALKHGLPLGDLNKNSLEEIWNGKIANKIRLKLHRDMHNRGKCFVIEKYLDDPIVLINRLIKFITVHPETIPFIREIYESTCSSQSFFSEHPEL